jgi:nucleoside-diphosphate-sugar epimerase
LRDAYASTKSQAEELVLSAAGNGLDAVVARPGTVFGDEAGRAGLIVDRLLAGSLRVLPAPSRMISPVWTGDLATALIKAAALGVSGTIYTVAGPAVSTGEFVAAVSKSAGVRPPRFSIPAWAVVVPLQLAWWGRKVTRWTPPVSVEAVRTGSVHDGSSAAQELGYSYTPVAEIFKRTRI